MTGRDRHLRLATRFDEVIQPPELPTTFSRGDAPAVQLLDGFVQGRQILGRFVVTPGLLGLRAAATGRAVRVTLRLRVDEESATWWRSRVGERTAAPDDVGAAPRLLQVRSQGSVRGAVLLARAPWSQPATPLRAAVSFALQPAELPADGLLLLELCDPPGALPPAAARLLPSAAVGVQPTEVVLEELPGTPAGTSEGTAADAVAAERAGWLATGDLPPVEGAGSRTVRGGVLLVDVPGPSQHPGAVSLELAPRDAAAVTDAPLEVSAYSVVDGSATGVRADPSGGGVRLTISGGLPGAVRVHVMGGPAAGWNVTTVVRRVDRT